MSHRSVPFLVLDMVEASSDGFAHTFAPSWRTPSPLESGAGCSGVAGMGSETVSGGGGKFVEPYHGDYRMPSEGFFNEVGHSS